MLTRWDQHPGHSSAHDMLAYAEARLRPNWTAWAIIPYFPRQEHTAFRGKLPGSPVCVPMDMAGACITMVSVMSERRMNRLNNVALSVGLPDFLTKGAGMFSAWCSAVYCWYADSWAKDTINAGFSSVNTAAADQEDFVSMEWIQRSKITSTGMRLRHSRMNLWQPHSSWLQKGWIQIWNRCSESQRCNQETCRVPWYRQATLSGSYSYKELVRSCEILEEVERLSEASNDRNLLLRISSVITLCLSV